MLNKWSYLILIAAISGGFATLVPEKSKTRSATIALEKQTSLQNLSPKVEKHSQTATKAKITRQGSQPLPLPAVHVHNKSRYSEGREQRRKDIEGNDGAVLVSVIPLQMLRSIFMNQQQSKAHLASSYQGSTELPPLRSNVNPYNRRMQFENIPQYDFGQQSLRSLRSGSWQSSASASASLLDAPFGFYQPRPLHFRQPELRFPMTEKTKVPTKNVKPHKVSGRYYGSSEEYDDYADYNTVTEDDHNDWYGYPYPYPYYYSSPYYYNDYYPYNNYNYNSNDYYDSYGRHRRSLESKSTKKPYEKPGTKNHPVDYSVSQTTKAPELQRLT